MGRGGEQLGGYRCARRGLHVDAAPVRWPRRERVLVRFVKMARPGSTRSFSPWPFLSPRPVTRPPRRPVLPGPARLRCASPTVRAPPITARGAGTPLPDLPRSFFARESNAPPPRPGRHRQARTFARAPKCPRQDGFHFQQLRGAPSGGQSCPRLAPLLRAPGSGAPGARALEGRRSSAVPDPRSALPPATLARDLGTADRAAEAPRGPRSHGC